MDQIIKHYGPAILTAIVFFCLGAIVMDILKSGGTVDTEFVKLITSFFGNMNSITPTPTPAG